MHAAPEHSRKRGGPYAQTSMRSQTGHLARRLLTTLAAFSMAASPAIAAAAGPAGPTTVAAAPAGPAVFAPGGPATYESVCAPVAAPLARCASLRRTDIAAIPSLPEGTAADSAGLPALVTGYSPTDLRSAYGLPSVGGAGRTVAIVDAYDLPTAAQDLATYRSQFGLPPCTVASGCFRKVDQNGGTNYPPLDAGWAGEIALDIEMVSAICPDCKILLVEADTADGDSLGTAVDTAVALGAVAVSNSYVSTPEEPSQLVVEKHFNHPGVVVTAATGDWGYSAGVGFPASSPFVVGVGGTSLVKAANTRGWTETAWSGTGSGCSSIEPKPYWQTDACVRKTTSDIAAVADPRTGVIVYDRYAGGWVVYGGTSVATPIVAAAAILAGRPAAGSYPSRRIYEHAASLWDVTIGANGGCFTYLCQAGVGYDGPTGLGTPNGTDALLPDLLDVGAGSRTSCALTEIGTLSCWGYGGNGETSAPAGSYVALSTGDSHSCAIDTAGGLHCWGADDSGQSSPPAGSYLSVSAGYGNSCAIDTNRAVRCWGSTAHGVTSPPSGGYSSVSVGANHACAIASGGAIGCWGDDGLGQSDAPFGTYAAVAAGRNHTCALTSLAAIVCWGDNSLGQLSAPAGKYIDLDAGAAGNCALRLSGSVVCWGDNAAGQNSPPPAIASRVALGTAQGCASLATSIGCWGGNADGQSTPLFATTSLPATGVGFAYSADVALETSVVPAPTFSLTAGSLPAGFTLSASGHISGSSASPVSATFTVTASNGIAPAASQSLTLDVMTSPPPGPPTSVVAVTSNGSAVVTWTAPVPNGGTPVTGYTVTSVPATTGCVMTMAMTCSFGSLTNHTQYTFRATATNDAGTGPAATATGTPLLGATYLPVTPNRLVDSRAGSRVGLGASLQSGRPAEFVVVGRSADPRLNIPTDAVAVTGNLTVTGQGSKGYLTLTPEDPDGTPATSTLNFPKADNRANALTIPLSGTGTLWVTFIGTAGTSTDVIFDVTGYFLPNSTGSTYVSLTPNRVLDSRSRLGLAAALRSGTPAWFTVTNLVPGDITRNVPAGATAVTGNLTVTGQTSKGYLSLTPTRPSGTPATSMLNFPKRDNRANALTIPLSGGKLWVTFIGLSGATANVIFDVTGYFIGNASGATYVALTPNRLVDSRPGAAVGLASSLGSRVSAEFGVVDRSADPSLNVPSSAVAITGNLTVTDQTSNGYLALTPDDPAGRPATSMLNFPLGDNRANALTVALSPTGTLWVTFVGTAGSRTHVIFDVTGYFEP
jgi:hypothetical protein